ncbi:MAG: PPC domain-containing protein, partial [Candidatus Thermoplasmatota archaeon]|nr:PPC domain-containing protein [Candidatus Thermoplasmatota archaeon]
MRSLRFLVGIMFILTALSPLMMYHNPLNLETFEQEKSENPFVKPIMLDDVQKEIKHAVGSPCPAIQNDGGSPGDAGNASSNTDKDLGNNPTTSFTGCADTTDEDDWYEFTMDANYNIEVTLSNYQNDYDLYLVIDEGNDTYSYVTYSWYDDPVESVTSSGTDIESTAGTYWIVVVAYNQGGASSIGDYNLDIWTNYTENCLDWNNPQNDGNTGQDAPQNWTDSPTNMGSNITSTYNGCLDPSDEGDVFAFDVPVNHTISVTLSMESGTDFDILLHQPNGSLIDSSYIDQGDFPTVLEESVTSIDSDFENQPGTYFVNVSQYSGNGNYTLEVWTNYTVPVPNLAIEDVSFNQAGNLGDVIPFNVTVINDGTLDVTDSFMVEVILSVDSDNTWVDHNIGNVTWSSGLAFNSTQVIPVNGVIPTNLVEGEYNVFVILDRNEMIAEEIETDNFGTAADSLTIGNGVNPCALPQNDAASGSDIGDTTSNSFDLGLDAEIEVRGCVDQNDKADLYKITISPNQSLEVTLITAPNNGADFDLVLSLPNGTEIDVSENFVNYDEFVTLNGTDYENSSGDYYLNVTHYGTNNPGGTYRLLVGQPDQSAYVAPFSCNGHNDLAVGNENYGYDVSSENPGTLGTVTDFPDGYSGIGCLGGADFSDAYTFSMGDYKNLRISFNATANSPFYANLTDSNNVVIATVDNTTYGSFFESLDNESLEGKEMEYTLTVHSNGGEGDYELIFDTIQPAQPDLVGWLMICPTGTEVEQYSNNEVLDLSLDVRNLRGPGNDQAYSVVVELVNGQNDTMLTIFSSAVSDSNPTLSQIYSYNDTTAYEQINQQWTTPENLSSGLYRCKLIVDFDNEITETDESNNVLYSEEFYITNIDELYANDEDRDGWNTTDTGDGKVDSCPSNPGTSTVDRYGCPDLDNDGVSNDNDILPIDPTQWY